MIAPLAPTRFLQLPAHIVPGVAAPVYVKMEGDNPTGSMKVRSAYAMLREAGVRAGETVVESTSGNMGTALAHVARMMKCTSVFVVDQKLPPAHRALMEADGAELVTIESTDPSGGALYARMDWARKAGTVKGWHWTNQYANKHVLSAFRELGVELIRDITRTQWGARHRTGQRLWFVATVGTGGSLTGVASVLKQAYGRHARVLAVDADGSRIFGRPPKTRYLTGVGSALFPLPNLHRRLIDRVAIVTDAQAFGMCHRARVVTHKQWDVGGSTGAAFAAIEAHAHLFSPEDLVVVLSPDRGDLYNETLYNPMWLQDRHLLTEVYRYAVG